VAHNSGCSNCSPTYDKMEAFLNTCDARFIATFLYARCELARLYSADAGASGGAAGADDGATCAAFVKDVALQQTFDA
jgi:hypothetical protein